MIGSVSIKAVKPLETYCMLWLLISIFDSSVHQFADVFCLSYSWAWQIPVISATSVKMVIALHWNNSSTMHRQFLWGGRTTYWNTTSISLTGELSTGLNHFEWGNKYSVKVLPEGHTGSWWTILHEFKLDCLQRFSELQIGRIHERLLRCKNRIQQLYLLSVV